MSRWTIRKEIFLNRGLKTTIYSLGKVPDTLGARVYYATRADAKKALKKMQSK